MNFFVGSTFRNNFIPDGEQPTQEKMRAYGDLIFLYFRARRYEKAPLDLVRRMIQPPIDIGLFQVFRVDGLPRACTTWAYLSDEADQRLRAGHLIEPSDWFSGDNFWIMDTISPYGQMSGARIMRWYRDQLPRDLRVVNCLRDDPDGTVKIVRFNRTGDMHWSPEVMGRISR